MDTNILDQLEDIFAEEFQLVQHDLGTMEEMVRQKMYFFINAPQLFQLLTFNNYSSFL